MYPIARKKSIEIEEEGVHLLLVNFCTCPYCFYNIPDIEIEVADCCFFVVLYCTGSYHTDLYDHTDFGICTETKTARVGKEIEEVVG